MKKTALIFALSFGIFLSSCTSNNQDKSQKDTSMKSMDATGPMQDTTLDTTTIHQLPGDSVPMRKEEKQ